VRRAKENRQVPKRYYRPEHTTCPHCGQVLQRCQQLWQKHVVFLHGRDWVVNMAYRCPNPSCTEPERVYASQAAHGLTVRGSSFALEVSVQIGYWRFWHRWTVTQIHEVLTQERRLPISEREVLYLIGVFLVLLRCTSPLRLAARAASFHRPGLFVALDALKPEKGTTALYVVRELKVGLVLHAAALLTADQRTLAPRLLHPVKDLGYRLRGVVSDDRSCTSILRIIAKPESQVAYLRFTNRGGGTRDGTRPAFSRTPATGDSVALYTPALGVGTAPGHNQPRRPPARSAGHQAFARDSAVSRYDPQAPLCRL
jgi:hypothetical protein